MTNSENNSPAPEACCVKKSPRCFRIFLGVAFIAAAGYIALATSSWQTPSGVAEPVKTGTIEQRLEAVERQLGSAVPAQATSSPVPLGPLTEEVDKLKTQVENNDSQSQMFAQKLVAEAFAFWDLREAVRDGRSFAPQLAALRNAAAGHAEILALTAKLDAFALLPPLTVKQLRDSFAVDFKAATAEATSQLSFWERVKALFAPLLSVRPLHDARFAAVEMALDAGYPAAALEAVKALPEDAQKSVAAWRLKLEARVALDEAVQALSDRFTTPPAPAAQIPAQIPTQIPAQIPAPDQAQETAPQ